MAIGVLLLASGSYDEFRGVTRAPSMRGLGRYSGIGHPHEIIRRKAKPEDFHNAMVCHWFRASVVLFAGFILFRIDKRQESLDPLSPAFGGTKALDELDEEMRNEEEAHKTPKP